MRYPMPSTASGTALLIAARTCSSFGRSTSDCAAMYSSTDFGTLCFIPHSIFRRAVFPRPMAMMQVGIVWLVVYQRQMPLRSRAVETCHPLIGEIRYSDQWESPHDRSRLSQDCAEPGRRGRVSSRGIAGFSCNG